MVVHETRPAFALPFAWKIVEKRFLGTNCAPCVTRVPTEFADMFLVVTLNLCKMVRDLCEVSTEPQLHLEPLRLSDKSGVTA
jgi:hypothetical protein